MFAINSNRNLLFLLFFSIFSESLLAQYKSQVWVADQGDGTYKNPVLHADYSDPDVIRVGSDFYLVSSSFENAPCLPILHSKDLVNWRILTNALPKQAPLDVFATPQHGKGVWAPSIRHHHGEFYIYYPDPDFGIYVIKATNPAGPWSEPILVEAGKGLIDPCPFWDDNGQVYLVHAYAGSRAGIKSILVLKKMDKKGLKTIDDGKIVFDGHSQDPTIEGPKMHKRNGYYYIFAPAGGVATGWQLVLRSKNIYGPYERKVVLAQGNSPINGPHQGAWVDTPTGENWFLHFQDKGVYGRIVHLQPMKWQDDWPVMGNNGTPVLIHKKPNVGKRYGIETPQESDEFNELELGKQWQWNANPKATWAFLNNGSLRLFTDLADTTKNLWQTPNVLLQKFPAPTFMATTKLTFSPYERLQNEKIGLTIMGFSYANIALKSKKDGIYLVYTLGKDADKGLPEKETFIRKVEPKQPIYFRVNVKEGGVCQFSYSFDGQMFTNAGDVFQAETGRWIGAKMGVFATRQSTTNDSGFADFDWFRVE